MNRISVSSMLGVLAVSTAMLMSIACRPVSAAQLDLRGDQIYVTSGSMLYQLDKAELKVVKRTALPQEIAGSKGASGSSSESAIVVSGNNLFVLRKGVLYKLRTSDLKTVQSLRLLGNAPAPRATEGIPKSIPPATARGPYAFCMVHCKPHTAGILYDRLVELVSLADRYRVRLTLAFTPQWMKAILGDKDRIHQVKTWVLNGHEVGVCHPGPNHPNLWDGYTDNPDWQSMRKAHKKGGAEERYSGTMDDYMAIVSSFEKALGGGRIATCVTSDPSTEWPAGLKYYAGGRAYVSRPEFKDFGHGVWGLTHSFLFAADGAAQRNAPQPSTDSGVKGTFVETLDKDLDGKVSPEEFPGPSAFFQRLDKNADGYVTADEAPRGLISPGDRGRGASSPQGRPGRRQGTGKMPGRMPDNADGHQVAPEAKKAYTELKQGETLGVFFHAFDYVSSRKAVEDWFLFLKSRDPEGERNRTVSQILEAFQVER